jgi:hypothetical protein
LWIGKQAEIDNRQTPGRQTGNTIRVNERVVTGGWERMTD